MNRSRAFWEARSLRWLMMAAAVALLPLNAVASTTQSGSNGKSSAATAAPGFHAFGGAHPDKVIASSHNDVSPAFRSLATSLGDTSPKPAPPVRSQPNVSTTTLPSTPQAAATSTPAPAASSTGAEAPVQVASFEAAGQGIPNSMDGWFPPDPNGAVGVNNYVEVINTVILMFDKSGNLVQAPNRLTAIFDGFGGNCSTGNASDPIVMYDRMAHRWVVSYIMEGSPFDYCVAVSTGEDPTGTYNRYDFPQILFPDYPKMGVWTDAYYFTTNQFSSSAIPDGSSTSGSIPVSPSASPGAAMGAFDRSSMIAGLPATMQIFFPGNQYWGVMPAYLDGQNLPPAGSPEYFIDTQRNVSNPRALYEWKMHIDWSNAANSVLSSPQAIPVAPWQATGGIPQPGTTTQLESASDGLMYRLSYRNFGDHESLYIALTVVADNAVNGNAGMRWYELRNPAGAVQVYQQQTYAPDSNFRWMGSVAADRQGNMALGYSLSSSSVFPSEAIASRSVTDPLGTMLNPETVVGVGGGKVFTDSGGARWGDYTSMAIDPVDDCTFWYTGMYLGAPADNDVRTRVVAFRFPSCLLATSTATVSSSANPGSTSGPVTLSAAISGGSGVPTGTVTFRDGATVLGTSTLSGGTATLATTLGVGSHTIVAAYSGDAFYSGTSSATFAQAISLAPGVPSGGNTPPGAPTAVSAAGGYLQASVTWTAPASNGGSAITGYTAVANPGGMATTVAAGSTTATVAGLSNGTAYTFTVLASNSLGAGQASAPSNTITPGPPGQPTNVVITGVGSGQVSLSWTAPAQVGAGPITSYDVLASPQGISTNVAGNFTSTTLGGLTNGVTYTIDVVANNASDSSVPSVPSAQVTPVGTQSLPGSPINVSAIAGDSAALVSWTPPVQTGGSPIQRYQVRATPGGAATTVAAGTSIWVTQLTNGTAYTFTVDAVNATGQGLFSNPSTPVTPDPYGPRTWAKLAPSTSPTARSDAGMAYDPLIGRTILFGGANSSGSPLADTWSWDGNTWTKLSPAKSPPARTGIANGMAWDDALGKIVLFGGHSSSSNLADTWTFDGTTWVQLSGTQPTARQHHSLAFDDGSGQALVLFGGNGSSNLNDTWQLIGTTWSKLPAQSSPPAAREYASLAFDQSRQQLIMFGGYSSKYLNDEWVLSAGVWYQMSSSGVPSARRGAALTYDPVLSKLVLFGGYNGSSYLSDTYLYDGMVDAWTRPSLTTMPSTRQLAGLAFGPGTSAVLFGGLNGSTRTADTWSLSGVLTPRVPSVPISPIAAASNGAAFVSWSWPVDNGGASISAFTVTASPGGQRTTVAGTRTSATLSGLTNGTSYSFTVAASNSVGTGPSSGSTNAVVPVNNGPTVPGAPTAVTATAGNAQASVSWTAPSSNGGASITGYTVTSSPGNFQATTTGATSATVGGLANGTAYTFAVTATNSVGTGPASGPSNSVSPTGPPTVPGAPTGVSALAGNTQASVSWVAPGSNGGSPLTGYTVTSSPGNFTVTASPNVTTATVTGLTNGTGYTFTVAATNSVGTGAQSAPSNSVTPAGLPGAPTGVTATAGIGQATVSWIAPASNGGSALTGYTVTSMPGNITVSAGPSATNATVAGLTNGTAYTFTVTATNSVGTGPASAPSNSVTPTATVPGAPTNVTGTPGNAQATVSWTPPASNGGSAITSFTVTQTPGGVTSNTGPSATSLTVFGLTNGTAYTFTVFATNGVGNGPASAPSNTVTPVGSATISNLVVGDTTNAANWSIQQNIQVGNLEYGDRTYTIKTLPSTLAGSQWIRPANASKTSTANPLVTFTISAPMTIYVAVDVRIGKRPWMDSSWTDTNTQITDSETTPATFEIFQKSITTAGQVSLGPNAASGSTYIQYLVIAR